jgi:hypothetical protein
MSPRAGSSRSRLSVSAERFEDTAIAMAEALAKLANALDELAGKRLDRGRPAWLDEGDVVAVLRNYSGHQENTYTIDVKAAGQNTDYRPNLPRQLRPCRAEITAMTSNSTTPPTPIAASPNRRPFTSADGGTGQSGAENSFALSVARLVESLPLSTPPGATSRILPGPIIAAGFARPKAGIAPATAPNIASVGKPVREASKRRLRAHPCRLLRVPNLIVPILTRTPSHSHKPLVS